MILSSRINRRHFIATTAVALAAPRLLTAQKSEKQLVIGEGEHRYEVLHNWAQLPDKYSWQKFSADKRAVWDGVRSFEARNNLRAMKKGDAVLFYHSNVGKEVVGIANVAKEAYADPTATEGDSCLPAVVTLT